MGRGVFCKKNWTFPQRGVHYLQYQYFFILHFTYLGVRTLPIRARSGDITVTNISKSFPPQDGGENQLAWNEITSLPPYVYSHFTATVLFRLVEKSVLHLRPSKTTYTYLLFIEFSHARLSDTLSPMQTD